jgi:hypothetical protein
MDSDGPAAPSLQDLGAGGSQPTLPDPVHPALTLDTGETEIARLNRNLNELLQELRISEVGVQILFAFLLALPFTSRFVGASQLERDCYFATLMLAAISSALLISPAAYHRIVFRHHEREHLVRYASVILLTGLGLLLFAMAGAVLVVLSFLFNSTAGAIAGAGVALWCGFFWYFIPIRMRLRHKRLYQSMIPPTPDDLGTTVGK